jgi:hypothetical protein
VSGQQSGDSHKLQQSSEIAAEWGADAGDLLKRQQSRSGALTQRRRLQTASMQKCRNQKNNTENPKTRMKQQELLEPDCYGYQPVESQEWMGIIDGSNSVTPTSITGVVAEQVTPTIATSGAT